jgi:tripartite-type tricarboxylate transporter receptor subunit TctC
LYAPDVVQDFEAVSLLADTPQWIVARKTLPAKDLRELIAWLKENPGKAMAGTVGVGGGGVIAGIYFQKSTGTSFPFVPYRGAVPLYQDMLAGHIDFAVGQAASTFVHVRNGNLRAYAVMAKTRWAAAPDVPTIDEAGVSGLYASYWHGLWLPKGTPQEVIVKLNAAVQAALADATVRNRFADQGQDIPSPEQQTPEALAAHQKAEIEKWWPLIKAANIKAE